MNNQDIPERTIAVPISELARLLKRKEKLDALEAAGVDNWSGYDLQWDEDIIGFKRIGNDVDAWYKYIEENYE